MDDRRHRRYRRHFRSGRKTYKHDTHRQNVAQSVVLKVDDEMDVLVNSGETIGYTQNQGNISRDYVIFGVN